MESEKRPNVVVFFTDQQRWDSTGLHGNPMGLTPNFDRLAAEGTHVANCSSCQPVCGPARASLQTGLYATRTGRNSNRNMMNPDLKGLAHYFNDAGYDTAYIGKWHLSDSQAVPGDQRMGYRKWLASNTLEFTSNAYRTRMYDNDCNPVELPGYRVDALADAAIRYIDTQSRSGSPFFLFLSFLEPHHQNHLDAYPAPPGYERRCSENLWTPPDLKALGGSSAQHLAGYWAMCKRLDEALGRLFDVLISLGIEEDTIILFTSDHGCHFKTRNGEYKRSGHESSIRIPAFLRGGAFTGGARLNQQISLVDLPPTLLEAAGIQVSGEMDGNSIMPLLRGDSSEWPSEAFVQISESQAGRAIRTDRWKYGITSPGSDPWALHARNYVESYLYDLHSDPYELCNLIDHSSHNGVCNFLRGRIKERMLQAGEPEPEIKPAEGGTRSQRVTDSSEFKSSHPYKALKVIPEDADKKIN